MGLDPVSPEGVNMPAAIIRSDLIIRQVSTELLAGQGDLAGSVPLTTPSVAGTARG